MDESYYKKQAPFFGTWYIKEFIGRGSYGQVFLITKEDVSGEYKAAMKVISIPEEQGRTDNEITLGMTEENLAEYYKEIVNSIVSEFKIMEKFKGCANVVSYDDHEIRRHPDGIGCDIYIRMELLEPMSAHFNGKAYDEKEIVKLGIDICRALELCHKNSIIHRDVKPGNIFISKNGDFKLGDFGVARTFERTVGDFSVKGTFDYMAPEVQLRKPYGTSVDIYSLGTVLYKMMNNGRLPFLPSYPEKLRAGDYDTALQKRLSGEELPPPSEASRAFASVIIKACKSDPEERYSSVSDMLSDLEEVYGMVALSKQEHRDYRIDEKGEIIVNMENYNENANNQQSVSPSNNGGSMQNSTIDTPVEEVKTENAESKPAFTQNSTLVTPITAGEKKAEAARETSVPAFSTPIGEKEKAKKAEKAEEPKETEKPKEEPKKQEPKPKKKKKAAGIIVLILLILIALFLLLIGGIIFAVQIPAVRDALPFNVDFMVFGGVNDEKQQEDAPAEENIEWRFDSYEERYPFYAVNRKYVDGVATDELAVDTEKTKYTEDEAKIFYFLNTETGAATRVLYLNGAPTDYVEYVSAMADEEWVVEGYDTDFREYARLYKYSKMTEKTAYTGRVFDHGYYVDMATMQKILYVDGAPVSSYEITALESDEWVLEGYDTGFREYARRYISSQPTEETKYTGVIYESVEYYKLDSNGLPYKVTYVNGAPVPFEVPEYIEGLGYVEEAWVIADDYEAGTYREYAVLHTFGVKDITKTKYTGLIKEIIEWKVEGYARTYPYYQYERKYVNGNRTSETRNTYPAVTDPSKREQPTNTPTTQSPTPQTPVVDTPVVDTPVQKTPDYINPDGSYNFSMLKLEYWYDAENREYKIYYDSEGNEVIRFATGAYKVERNKKK